MNDLKRISWLAILLIVLLRMSIGWQFLYEGMWKYDKMSGPDPWTSEGYLKNAQGPFRDHFRNMTGDPDDLNWLDYEHMSRKWYAWRDKFVEHYQLNDEQQAILNIILDASAEEDTPPSELPPFPVFTRKLDKLPESVDLGRFRDVLVYDEKTKELKAIAPIKPGRAEEDRIRDEMLDVVATGNPEKPYVKRTNPDEPADPVHVEFLKAFDYLVKSSREPIDRLLADMSRQKGKTVDTDNFNHAVSELTSTVKRALPFRHRLAASLLGDPDRVGVYGELNERGTYDIEMGTVIRSEQGEDKHLLKFGEIREYKKLLEEYEQELERASMSYQYDHAAMLGKKAAAMRAKLVGPVKTMEAELKDTAFNLLTPEQIQLGALPPEDTPLHRADMMAMWGLLILGSLLLLGLFSRLAAFLGAAMVLSFYLVMPPLPGLPPAPGPEHSLIVNKNLIEVIALLGIAALPTGKWFGLDAIVSRYLFGRK